MPPNERDASLIAAIGSQRLWAEPEGRAVCYAISARMRAVREALIPDRSLLVVGDEGVTVAHIWQSAR